MCVHHFTWKPKYIPKAEYIQLSLNAIQLLQRIQYGITWLILQYAPTQVVYQTLMSFISCPVHFSWHNFNDSQQEQHVQQEVNYVKL